MLLRAWLCWFLGLTLPLAAQETSPETFEVVGHTAYVQAASQPAPGRPWLWYAPTLRSLAFGERKGYFEAFLKAGISIAGCDLGEVCGAPASTAKFTRFYEAMVARGYSPKPILLGQSRGGLMTLAWAVRHPDKVRAWVGIYPVCNLASWPMRRSLPSTLADYGLSETELTARLSEFNPIDHLQACSSSRCPCSPCTATAMSSCPTMTTRSCCRNATKPVVVASR